MEMNTNREAEMTRTAEQIKSEMDALHAKAPYINTKEQSRKWADDMRALRAEMKEAAK